MNSDTYYLPVDVINNKFTLPVSFLSKLYEQKRSVCVIDIHTEKQMHITPIDYNVDTEYLCQWFDFQETERELKDCNFLNIFHHTIYNELKEYLHSSSFDKQLNVIKEKRKEMVITPEEHEMFYMFAQNIEFIRGVIVVKDSWEQYELKQFFGDIDVLKRKGIYILQKNLLHQSDKAFRELINKTVGVLDKESKLWLLMENIEGIKNGITFFEQEVSEFKRQLNLE